MEYYNRLLTGEIWTAQGLPFHQRLHDFHLCPSGEDQPELQQFLYNILDTGNALAADVTTYKDQKTLCSPPAIGDVKTKRKRVDQNGPHDKKGLWKILFGATGTKYWFARSSQHTNQMKFGTATYDEFDFGIRLDHSIHEQKYTPGIADQIELVNWRDEIRSMQSRTGAARVYTCIEMSLRLMIHKLPKPLQKRGFAVVVISARVTEETLLVVQLPVDTSTISARVLDKSSMDRFVSGSYTSVERVLRTEDQLEWVMSTTSDAGGFLPLWLQRFGLPKAIAKDVGLFMAWTHRNRNTADSE